MAESAATPAWLLESETAASPIGCSGARRREGALEKTLDGLAKVLRQAIASEETAARSGLLQSLDARAKLLGVVALLVAVGLVRHIPVLAGIYLFTLVLAAASRIGLGWFIKRVWLFIPLFSGVIVAPAMFSFVTPGEVVLPLGHWLGHDVGLTRQGLTSAGLIVCRVATSISLVVLLTLTTSWPRLLAALRALFVPRLLVLVLGMAYRYIFVLLDSISEMVTARRARTVAARRSGRRARAIAGFSGGALFGKAHALSEEIHQAMLARGFHGEARTLERLRFRAVDGIWLAACLALAVLVVGGDRALGL
ncbi:MAG: cobalt ECF transporter T component CbiQ [Gaiellaceae bacterium]